MANQTIEGCVNRSTGAITFAGEACDSGDYTGCIVRVGHPDYAEHPDMVAVTFTEANCPEDTYFGCRDLATGKFKVVIPDDCCIIYSGSCSVCENIPDTIYVTFESVTDCSGCVNIPASRSVDRYGSCASALNAKHTLSFVNEVTGRCQWKAILSGSYGSYTRYIYPNCLGDTTVFTLDTIGIYVFAESGKFYAVVVASDGGVGGQNLYISEAWIEDGNCIALDEAHSSQQNTCSDWVLGIDGTATITRT